MSIFGTILPDNGPPVQLPPPITAWSYSRLSTYQKCPLQAKYKFVEKRPEPESDAIVRGKSVHGLAAKLIQHGETGPLELTEDETAVIEVLRPWRGLLAKLHERRATPECQQALTQAWTPTDWFGRGAWLRVIFDAVADAPDGETVDVFEFKTGKKHPDHEHQKSLYAVSAAATYPDATAVNVNFVYFDQDPTATMIAHYSKADADAFRPIWVDRARPMLTDTEFRPKTGPHCRWCPFSKTKGGPCNVG